MKNIKKPNFLFVGPDKSGSSFIYKMLNNHPQCFVPPAKDLYFFDRFYYRGIEWYLNYFKNAKIENKAIGEICHDYLFSEKACNRIKSHFPEMKIIICLRNPIERSFSHYLYLVRSGLTKHSFINSCNLMPELVNNSMYYVYVKRYLDVFGKNNVKILFFDDLVSNSNFFKQELINFLQIDNFDYDMKQKVRPASKPRHFVLSKFLKFAANVLRLIGANNVLGVIKNNNFINKFFYTDFKNKPKVSQKEYNILKDIYYHDISSLAKLLNRDLSHWH